MAEDIGFILLSALLAGLYARLALLSEGRSKSQSTHPIAYTKRQWSISSSGWGDVECREYLRFTKSEIEMLIVHLKLSEWVNCRAPIRRNRYVATPELALCMLLYRMSSPNRLKDMVHIFGVSRSFISTVINDLAVFLYHRYSEKLHWDHDRLSQSKLQQYANAISKTMQIPTGGLSMEPCDQ